MPNKKHKPAKTIVNRNLFIALILIIASILRFYKLTQSPPSINWDEASIGYNAYSVLKTGKDEWGTLMPVSFKAFGEHKLPGMIYASIPAITLFGLNEFSLRITPVIIGLLAIYFMYKFTSELTNEKTGLIAAFLMAISPWHIHISRISFEAGLALLFIELSLLYFVKSLKNTKYLYHTTIFAIFSIYTYNSAKIVIPILTLVYLLLFTQRLKNKKHIIGSALIGFILLLPIFSQLTAENTIRWDIVNFAAQPGYTYTIELARNNFKGPILAGKIIHNQYTHYTYHLTSNALKHFAPSFLFLKGDSNTQRSIQNYGLLHLLEAPLVIYGIYLLMRKKKLLKLILPLLIVTVIPGSITVDAPSALRSLNLIIPILFIESLGVVALVNQFKKGGYVLLILAFTSLYMFTGRIYLDYPHRYASDWQYGYKEAVRYAMEEYDNVENIYFTTKKGEPYIFTLFFGDFDPTFFQNPSNSVKTQDPIGWTHVTHLGKFAYVNFSLDEFLPEKLITESGEAILIALPDELNESYIPIQEIHDPGGNLSFQIYRTGQ